MPDFMDMRLPEPQVAGSRLLRPSAEYKEALERELADVFEQSYSDGADLRAEVEIWRNAYAGILPEKSEAWSANVNIPITEATIDTAAEQLEALSLGVDPIFEVEARNPRDEPNAPEEEARLQYWAERTRLRQRGGLAIHHALIDGAAFLSVGVRRRQREQRAPIVLASELDAEPTVACVTIDDVCLVPHAAPSLARARGAFRRTWLSWGELREGAKSKRFYKDAVERLGERWRQEPSRTLTQEQQRIGVSAPERIWAAEFECWEGVYRFAGERDKAEREYLLTVAFNMAEGGKATVLRASDFRELYGEEAAWPLHVIRANPRPGVLWGRSMAEQIRGIQAWINAMFNGTTDALQLTLRPPIGVVQSSPAASRGGKWGPMQKWPMTNPADVQVLSPSPAMVAAVRAGLSQMEMVRQWTERVSGVSDLMMGKTSASRRTAFEISAVVEAGNQKFEQMVSRLECGMEDDEGFEGVARSLMTVVHRFLGAGPVGYRQEAGWRIAQPGPGSDAYRYIAKGTSRTANPETRFRRAIVTNQAMAQDPFLVISPLDSPETLVAKVRRIWEARLEFWQAMGHKAPRLLIGEEPRTFEEAIRIAAIIAPEATQNVVEAAMGLEPAGAGGPPAAPVGGPAAAAPGGPGGRGLLAAGGGGAPAGPPGVPGPPVGPGLGEAGAGASEGAWMGE